MNKKIWIILLGIVYALVLPLVILLVVIDLSFFSTRLNPALTFTAIMVQIDLASYLIYQYFKKNKNEKS